MTPTAGNYYYHGQYIISPLQRVTENSSGGRGREGEGEGWSNRVLGSILIGPRLSKFRCVGRVPWLETQLKDSRTRWRVTAKPRRINWKVVHRGSNAFGRHSAIACRAGTRAFVVSLSSFLLRSSLYASLYARTFVRFRVRVYTEDERTSNSRANFPASNRSYVHTRRDLDYLLVEQNVFEIYPLPFF